ncbi:ribonuclease J [Lacrimispora amygdalina]|uniref:ribonuclease J n=1 Tax=Lacrimispora amygdalina TaxID=253257 RepID=UPI000BE48328|nr:ribonuclease J [Lacrimispora amygdalina]
MEKEIKTDRRKFVRKKTESSVKIIPLGGLSQIGMNMTAIETGKDIIVIDCGMAFPTDDMPGIDRIIPDVTYLKNNITKIKGFVITHGHEDHIGAIPYIINDIPATIYGTRLTIELIKDRLMREGLPSAKTKIIEFGKSIILGGFKVEFIKTNHSIQDAAALAITTPAGKIFHTGDFKIDYTPVYGDQINLSRMAELGREGVLAVLSDSTNATKSGTTMSERTVGETFDTIFAKHDSNRLIIGTYSSNVDRVQQIINTAANYKRRVVIDGRSMKNTISIASKIGYIKIPEETLIDIEEAYKYPDEKVVIVATGSQGESMASLSRMSTGIHKYIDITSNDVIVLSATPIPGNERAVANVISRLSERHARVIFQDTHVSGHACQEEIKLIYSLLQPKYAIPVHGDYRQRYAAKETIDSLRLKDNKTIMLSDGDILTLTPKLSKISGPAPHGEIMIDLLGARDIGGRALKDRKKLSNGGIVIISITVDSSTKSWLPNPSIASFGLSRSDVSNKLFAELRTEVDKFMRKNPIKLESEHKILRNKLNAYIGAFIHTRTRLETIVFTTITEI